MGKGKGATNGNVQCVKCTSIFTSIFTSNATEQNGTCSVLMFSFFFLCCFCFFFTAEGLEAISKTGQNYRHGP